MIQFIEIPETFAAFMEGQQIGPNVFASISTLDGRRVVSPNAQNEFTAAFVALKQTGWEPIVIELSAEDFPKPEPLEE